MEQDTFSQLGRIEAIRQLFEGTPFTPFRQPLSFEAAGRDCVITAATTMLEGVDFNLVYFPLKHLGAKAVISVTGELYAGMARPRTLSVTIGVSAKLDFQQIRELWEGMVHSAKEHGYDNLSLDLLPSRNGLVIGVCATGVCSILTKSRKPAPKSKDLLCVSGSLGAAYLGLQVLERENRKFEGGAQPQLERFKMLVGAYLKPELPCRLVGQMEESGIYASSGYLVNRGLADAVLRMSRDTGLGVKVYAEKIPFEGGSFDLGREMDIDPVSAAMNGGEDYKLLFSIPILQLERFRRDFQTFDIIGHLALPEAGTSLVTPEGVELEISAQGWN